MHNQAKFDNIVECEEFAKDCHELVVHHGYAPAQTLAARLPAHAITWVPFGRRHTDQRPQPLSIIQR